MLRLLLVAGFSHFANTSFGAATASFVVSEHSEADGVDEAAPAAACNGKNCLVVWKDDRSLKQPYHRGQYLLYGRRFDMAGNPLDATSFAIQDEPFVWNNEGLTLPAIANRGRDYVVVWVTRLRHVEARRVLGDGTVKTNRIEIAQAGTASGQPAVASTHRGYLVAWTDRTNNNGDVYATLLDRSARVTRTVSVAVDSSNAQFPVAASVGNDYVILWRELAPLGKDTIRAALVTQAGEVRRLDDFPASLANWVSVASNGRNYFVTWQSGVSAYSANQLSGRLLNRHGDTIGDELLLARCGAQSLPAALPAGRNFTLLWRENPYVAEATLYTLGVSGRGVAKAEPAPMNSEVGWSGYGAAAALSRSNVLVVLEQKTLDYYNNGYLSRVHGTVMDATP